MYENFKLVLAATLMILIGVDFYRTIKWSDSIFKEEEKALEEIK